MRPIDKIIVPVDEVDYAAAKNVESLKLMKAAHLPQVRMYLADELEKAGATLAASAAVIAEAHQAKKTTYFQHEGMVTDSREDVDHKIRLSAAELNLKARGELDDHASTNIFMEMTDEQVAGIAAGTIDPATLIDLGPRVNELMGPKDAPSVTPSEDQI